MQEVKLGQEAVRIEATNIVNSLTVAPKSGGRWGEQQFKNLLELAGLTEHVDFESEVSRRDEGGSILRPDFVIRLPGNRELIVDIKCPIEAYKSAISETDPKLKKEHFERHAKAVRGHAAALSKKSYWVQFDRAPDFVILYIPGDNFLSAALEYDQNVWQEAADRRVVISGPATFLPLARTISMMWNREGLADKANEVLEVGKDLHLNLSIMSDRIRKLGTDMERSMHSYNSVIKSFDGRVASKAKRFEELGLHQSDKTIGDFSSVDQIAAPIVRLDRATKEGEDQK